jgi:hypothetical protein
MQKEENSSQKIKALHAQAKKLIDANESEEFVLTELCKNGITVDYAAIIIDNVLNDIRDKKDFWKLLVMGSFITIAGSFISYTSYTNANDRGGYYFIFWGIVVAGIVMIFRAFTLYRK